MFMPDLLFRLGPDGQPLFKEFAAAIQPTEFAPGKIFGTGTMAPIDYCVELADGRIAPPANLDIATIQQQELAMTFRFHIPQYLIAARRRLEGARLHRDAGRFRLRSTRAPNSGATTAAPRFKNWEEVADPRNPLGGRQGVDERIMLRELLRRVDMMVLLENRLDALVRLHTPLPPAKIGGATDPSGGRKNLRAGIVLRPERRPDRGPDPGGLRHDRLRPGLRPQPRRHPLRFGPLRQPDHPAAPWPAVLAGLPRRARQGRRRVEDRRRLRSRLEAPHPTTRLRPPGRDIARGRPLKTED